MYLTVTKNQFANYMFQLFPNKFTREGLNILFEYLDRHEKQSGIEEKFDPQQIQQTYVESAYVRFLPSENRFESPVGEGVKLESICGGSGCSLRELQQNIKKQIEKKGSIVIGFTFHKTVVYTQD